MMEISYDPSLDIFLNAVAVLFLAYRLRRSPEAARLDLWLFGAGAIGLGGSLFGLLRAASIFHAISPREEFLADAWDSLVFLQIVFGSILLVSFFAMAFNLRPVRRRAQGRSVRRFFLLQVSAAAVAGWLCLSNAAPLVDSFGMAWLLLLSLTLALTFAALRLSAQETERGSKGPRIVARFGFVGAAVPLSGERRLLLGGALGVAAVLASIAVAAFVLLTFFSDLFGYAEARLAGMSLAMALGWLFLTALLCLLPTCAFLGVAFWRSRCNRRRVIASRDDVKRLSGELRRSMAKKWQRARSLSRPRALVAATAHALWRETVLELINVADLVFLDLSDVSENVQWELDRLRERFPAKAVILVPEGTPFVAGPELRVVSYRSYPELEKALGELMASEALAPVPALSWQAA